MNDSFGGGFTQQGGDAKPENKSEGTLPVFIKQIHSNKEDVMKMWGSEFKMVTTVAVVRNIDHSSTKITYELEDLSGRIKAHLWVEEGDMPTGAGIMLNTYARVIGAVRQQGDVKTIMIYKIQPAKSANEVNTHYLEVINARYQSEEYYRIANGGGGDTVAKMEVDGGLGGSTQLDSQSGPQGKEKAIFNVIQASQKTHQDTGINRQELSRKFPHISATEMANILEKMSGDGHIYSTIDADHFLSCF